MEEWDVRSFAKNREEGSALIASNLEAIEKLFHDCVFIANEFDIRLMVDIKLPDGYKRGHNQYGLEGHWSASAASC